MFGLERVITFTGLFGKGILFQEANLVIEELGTLPLFIVGGKSDLVVVEDKGWGVF